MIPPSAFRLFPLLIITVTGNRKGKGKGKGEGAIIMFELFMYVKKKNEWKKNRGSRVKSEQRKKASQARRRRRQAG